MLHYISRIFKFLLGASLLLAFASFAFYASGDPKKATPFFTKKIARGDLISTITATGSLKALSEVKVGSQLSGQISKIFVDFNDPVRAGQTLAKLDSRTYEARVREAKAALRIARAKVLLQQAAIEQAEANLVSAQATLSVVKERMGSAQAQHVEAQRDYQRKETLRKRGTTSQAVLDQAKSKLLSAGALLRAEKAQVRVENASISNAKASLRRAEAEYKDAAAAVDRAEAFLWQAEIDLSRTDIQAPIGGIVIGRDVEEGQTVAATLEAPTLFQIANDLSKLEIHIRVDEADIGQVRAGQQVRFGVDTYRGKEFLGTVVQIRKTPIIVDNVVTYTVVASAVNPELLLLPGMTATVHIVILERRNVTKVPNAALRFHPPKPLDPQNTLVEASNKAKNRTGNVWIPDGAGGIRMVAVDLGVSNGAATELLDDTLRPNDSVVVGIVPEPERKTFFGLRIGF